ncbi:helix-turn-helix domain-containing protein [Butyricicoccus sp. AM27-36]|nr:helix-turn-helix domain-containing protein [Butyricicoccus sp. AM27-36]
MAMMMAEKIPLPILQLDHAMALLEDHSYAQVIKLTGISKSTLIRERKRWRQFGEPEK